jgi:acetyl-CoA acetyltransferase
MSALATVVGIGTSNFGKQSLTAQELVAVAVAEAVADAGVDPRDIDAVFVGNVFNYPGTAYRALLAAGFADAPIVTVESACASGSLAVHLAAEAVRRGDARLALAIGVEKMTDEMAGPIPTDPHDIDAAGGMVLPAVYAMSATRYMDRFGLTPEQLAQVSVKNHRNALANPRAQYRGDFTVQQVLESREIATPLTLLQCSPISDGAGAAVIGAPDAGFAGPTIRSSRYLSARPWPDTTDRVWNFELIERASRLALGDAGLVHDDIDVVELHDAFTIGELVTLEALGFFPEGGAGRATQEGQTERDGRIPVNLSGGLLSRGHPLGATGVAQLAEVVWQLRGDAGERQLSDPRFGLVETMGGNVAGLSGNGCVVMTLERGADR